MALLGTVSDNFDAGIGGWSVTAGSVTADTGGVRISHSTVVEFPHAEKVGSWDLTGSYAFVEVRDYGNQSLTAHEVYFIVESNIDPTDQVIFVASQNALDGYRKVDNAYTAATGAPITLNTTTHRWLRIREAAGTLYWDTSPDGTAPSWTNRFSLAASISWTDVHVNLSCGNNATGTASYAVFDNFNSAPAVTAANSGFFNLIGGSKSLVSTSAPTSPPVTALKFNVLQEYFGDGGTTATNQFTDLGINAAGFRANLSSGENTYLSSHHPTFCYIALPHDLISPAADTFLLSSYPDSTDTGYRTTMAGLVASYGIDDTYLFACPEWDNDPANQGWATNRYLEGGSTGGGTGRYDLPTGMTRQQAYDQWIHFYLTTHHGGNTNHHQLGQLLSVPYTTRGYKIMCNNVYAGSCHYSYEMGMDRVTLQRNNDDIGSIVGAIGFIRGAGTQYGKPWGIDTSQYRGMWGASPFVTAYSGTTLTAGWSTSTYKRHRYLAYMTGADVLMEEAVAWAGTATTINGRGYNPEGVNLKNFCDFSLTRHPHTQRGVPHAPVAIMKDHISFFEPRWGQWNQGRNVWTQQMSANGGENMLHNLLDMLFPGYNTWGTSSTTNEPMGAGRWGEQFNILTERADATALSAHSVVMLSTNATMDSTLQTKLAAFASAGGIVVINAKQLSGTAHETLTGIHLVGTASTSGTVTWDSDSSTTSEGGFNYSTITLGTATVLAHSGTSTPQVTKNVVGSGEVWVTLPDYLSNTANNATLGLAAKVIGTLINRFNTVTVTSTGGNTTIDYAVCDQAGTNGLGITVTIINNAVPSASWSGTVTFNSATGTVSEWIADTAVTSSLVGGKVTCSVTVPGGDVKVFALSR